MKKILPLFIAFFFSVSIFGQKKEIYATVFDEDKNPIARGLFKSAADSGIIILVDDLEVFVAATEITVLKIEKNSSKAEFLKLGAAVATDAAAGYLINKTPEENDTLGTDSSSDNTVVLLTETKEILFGRIQKLLVNLQSGVNDLATVSINNSQEKFLTKLRLLQQYSMDKEIVSMNDFVQNEQSQNEIISEQTNEEVTATEEKSQDSQSQPVSNPTKPIPVTKPTTVTLNKGFYIVKPATTSTKSNTPVPTGQKQQTTPKPKTLIITSPAKTPTETKPVQSKNSTPVLVPVKKETSTTIKKN